MSWTDPVVAFCQSCDVPDYRPSPMPDQLNKLRMHFCHCFAFLLIIPSLPRPKLDDLSQTARDNSLGPLARNGIKVSRMRMLDVDEGQNYSCIASVIVCALPMLGGRCYSLSSCWKSLMGSSENSRPEQCSAHDAGRISQVSGYPSGRRDRV